MGAIFTAEAVNSNGIARFLGGFSSYEDASVACLDYHEEQMEQMGLDAETIANCIIQLSIGLSIAKGTTASTIAGTTTYTIRH